MLTLLFFLALPADTAVTPQATPEPARCRPGADQARAEERGPPGVRPLEEMPDARPVLTVYRQVNGCNVLLVRENGRIIEEPVGRPEQRRVFRP